MPSPPKYNKEEVLKQLIPILKKTIGGVESSNNYNPPGNDSALGKYQFMKSLHWEKIKNFAKKNGYGELKSYSDFINNHPLQEDFFERYWVPNEIYPKAIELYEQYGNQYGLNLEDIASLVHHRGSGGNVKTKNPSAHYILANNLLDNKFEGDNPSPMEHIQRSRKWKNEAETVKIERIFSDDEKKKIVKDFHNKYDAVIFDRTGMSDDVKAMKIQDIWKNAWQKGEYNVIKEEVESTNKKIRQKAIDDEKEIHKLNRLITNINEGNGDYSLFSEGFGPQGDKYNFGKDHVISQWKKEEILSDFIDFDNNKVKFEYQNIIKIGKDSLGKPSIVIDKKELLLKYQNQLNKYLPEDQKLNLISKDKDGKYIKGEDFIQKAGALDIFTSKKSKNDAKYGTLDLPSLDRFDINPERVYNSQTIPVIDINPEWLTPYEAEKKIEQQSTTTPETVAESTQQDAQPTKAMLDIQAQEQAPISPTGTLDDWFSMDFDYTQQAPAGDIDYKQPDIPFAEIGASLFGIFMGADAAGTDIPMRDEKVGDAVIQYVNDLKRISQQGLSPEEEGYRKQMLKESFSAGVDNIVRASGGNRNAVLGNLGRLDAQMQTGMMDIALQDLQKKQEALFKYGEALQYIDSVDLNRDVANNERLYQDAIATRESGAKLMQGGIATLLDSIQYYKENAPGSANFALKSFYNREAFGYDPNIKDNGLGDTPYTLSYLRKLDSQAKAYQMKNEEAGEMYAALPMETKVQINDFTQKTAGDMDLTYKLIQEAHNNNGELAGGINYGNLVEAQKTGNIGIIIDPNLEKVGTQNSSQYNPNAETKNIQVSPAQEQDNDSGIMNFPFPNGQQDYSTGGIKSLSPEELTEYNRQMKMKNSNENYIETGNPMSGWSPLSNNIKSDLVPLNGGEVMMQNDFDSLFNYSKKDDLFWQELENQKKELDEKIKQQQQFTPY